jgi:hypothetical protein
MTLMAALPELLKFASGRCRTSTPAEMLLMVSEKMDAIEEAKAIMLAVATHRL